MPAGRYTPLKIASAQVGGIMAHILVSFDMLAGPSGRISVTTLRKAIPAIPEGMFKACLRGLVKTGTLKVSGSTIRRGS